MDAHKLQTSSSTPSKARAACDWIVCTNRKTVASSDALTSLTVDVCQPPRFESGGAVISTPPALGSISDGWRVLFIQKSTNGLVRTCWQREPKACPPSTEPDAKAQKNFTDPDSRIMKSKDGFVQAYNAQAAVDEEGPDYRGARRDAERGRLRAEVVEPRSLPQAEVSFGEPNLYTIP
jgi:hypothetical protein